jgi:prefoldin subunit 5
VATESTIRTSNDFIRAFNAVIRALGLYNGLEGLI